jgi:hypothetical protein
MAPVTVERFTLRSLLNATWFALGESRDGAARCPFAHSPGASGFAQCSAGSSSAMKNPEALALLIRLERRRNSAILASSSLSNESSSPVPAAVIRAWLGESIVRGDLES